MSIFMKGIALCVGVFVSGFFLSFAYLALMMAGLFPMSGPPTWSWLCVGLTPAIAGILGCCEYIRRFVEKQRATRT